MSGRLRLLLTADAEVFGDGSGRVEPCVVRPSEEMAAIAARHDQRLTLFLDVSEYVAFREIEDAGRFPPQERPATRIEELARSLVAAGHDVQLHLHPQWTRYEVRDDGSFALDLDRWRLGPLPDAAELLADGCARLEALLRPVDPEYRCRAFRAGAWCIQPEANVLAGMAAAGLRYDTTVAPGAHRDDGLTFFDFRGAPADRPRWRVRDDVLRPEDDGPVEEIPIFTTPMGPVRRILFAERRRRRGLRGRPEGCEGAPAAAPTAAARRPGRWARLAGRFRSRIRMLDFSVATFEEMRWFVRRARHRFATHLARGDVPLVAIGHPKTFDAGRELDRFLAWVGETPWIRTDSPGEPSVWR